MSGLTESEIAALKEVASIKRDPICPKCATRYVDPRSEFGWCVNCDARKQRSLEAKRKWWEEKGADKQRERRAAEAAARRA